MIRAQKSANFIRMKSNLIYRYKPTQLAEVSAYPPQYKDQVPTQLAQASAYPHTTPKHTPCSVLLIIIILTVIDPRPFHHVFADVDPVVDLSV